MVYGKNYDFWHDKIQEGLPPRFTPGRDKVLCSNQIQAHSAGFQEARLVKTIFGYSVRYASGLDNFAVLFGGRMMGRHVSYQEALQWGKDWVDAKPEYRALIYSAEEV